MKKGFLATAILLTAISTTYYALQIQETLNRHNRLIKNHVQLNQETQETKYRLNQGFRDTIKNSMKKTTNKDPIVREQLACEELLNWLQEHNNKNTKVTLKAGHLDPVTYQKSENTGKATLNIAEHLKKDPAKALGAKKPEATLCINYLSIKGKKATVRNNGYIDYTENPEEILGEPSFIFKQRTGKRTQLVIIPSNTKIETREGTK